MAIKKKWGKLKKTSAIATLGIFFMVLVPLVFAHGNLLYNINLDFDPAFKEKINTAAKQILGESSDPIVYHFDRELILAGYSEEYDHYAIINPQTFEESGFRKDDLISEGPETLSPKERKELAIDIFDALPQGIKSQLEYGGEEQLYVGTYLLTWYRKIDGILIGNEGFEVEIDPVDGDVIYWKLTLFANPKDQITKNPAFSWKIAQDMALQEFDAKPTDQLPFIYIEKNRPVWVAKVESIYPFYAAYDALNGRLLYAGPLKTTMPSGYDAGRELPCNAK